MIAERGYRQAQVPTYWLGVWGDQASSEGKNLMYRLEQIMKTLKSITYVTFTGSWAEKHLNECGGQLLFLFWWLLVIISKSQHTNPVFLPDYKHTL